MTTESEERAPSRAWFGFAQMVRDIRALPRAPLVILVTVPLVLTLLEYWGMPWHYTRNAERQSRLPGRHMEITEQPVWTTDLARGFAELDLGIPAPAKPFLWWSLACLILTALVPMLAGWLFAKQSPRQMGVRLKGTGRDGVTYLVLFLLFLPVVWWASRQPGFRETYPFYKPRGSPWGMDFLLFQAAYFLQFFAVEYFFRGFIVLGLKPHLGLASVLVMLAPYCMIHYYKPMPEALGAVGAGIVLGVLAWRTGTIVYGWFLHYGVALSMDVLSLSQGPST